MSRPSLRQTILRSGPSPEAEAARNYEHEVVFSELRDRTPLMNFGSSRRYQPLNAMSRTVYVPMTRGQPRPVVLRPRDHADLQSAIDAGFETGQLKQNEVAVNASRRAIRVNGGSRRTHEEIRAPGAMLRNVAGHYILKAGAISVTSGPGRNPRIDIPGARVDRANFAGFSGDIHSNADFNNPNFTNASVTIKGAPRIHNARTGNFVVGRQSFGGIAEAAARHAVDEQFHATDGTSSFNVPSMRAIQHAVSAHTTLGTAPAISNHMSAEAAALIRAQMQMQYGNARVKPEELRPH